MTLLAIDSIHIGERARGGRWLALLPGGLAGAPAPTTPAATARRAA